MAYGLKLQAQALLGYYSFDQGTAVRMVRFTGLQLATLFQKRESGRRNHQMYSLAVAADPQFGGRSSGVYGFLGSSTWADRQLGADTVAGAWRHLVFRHSRSVSRLHHNGRGGGG